MSENWNFQPVFAPYNTAYQKARVGLAVLCRCKDSCVQCLLQKRGPASSTPNKWSFPGGRLEQPGDLDEDGAVGTRRELMEECGGGVPPGLPDLIHIECCKSGKSKQTLYHVYVIDTDSSQGWDSWTPAPQRSKDAMIDASVKYITLRDHQFTSVNGYSWVDISVLIQECVELNTDQINNSELQHGLVRWVQMYGDHILRTLMARSPKLSHSIRRYSNSSSSSSNSGGRPRANSGGRPRRFAARVSSSGMLQPPFAPGQFVRPLLQGTSVGPFYGALPGPGSEQFSPPHHLGVNHHGVILTVPSPPSPGDAFGAPPTAPPHNLLFIHPPSSVQPSPSPSSTPVPPRPPLPSPGHTNLIVVGAGCEGLGTRGEGLRVTRPSPSQDILSPGPQDILSPGCLSAEGGGAHVPTGSHTSFIMATPPGHLSPLQPHMRKDVVCKHFIAGQCPYAEKCWFGHPEDGPMSAQSRDAVSSLTIPSSPLQLPIPSYNATTSTYGPPHSSHTPAYGPPHSSHTPTYNAPQGQPSIDSWGAGEALWSHMMPGMYRARPTLFPGVHAGLSPGQPFLFLRPPLPGAHVPSPVPLFPIPYSPPADTALTFALLSEVTVRGSQGDVISEVSHLAVCADHFYLSVGPTVQAYKILFGGYRSYQDCAVVQECCNLKHAVTCLHCSRQMPSLLAIGTESGGVYTWDMKRGPRILTALYEPEEKGSAVTALIHFMTSINTAQVVVAGGGGGGLTWYISQPPQKTFSVLFTDSQHSPAAVVSLQILGGLLLSGGRDGRIFLWNMSNHRPQLDTVLCIQCSVLKDIHVLQGNGFLTVGIAPTDATPTSPSVLQSQKGGTPIAEEPPTNGHHSNPAVEEPPTNGHHSNPAVTYSDQVDALADNMFDLKVHGDCGRGVTKEERWCASVWENERPPRCMRTVQLGPLVSNAFYHQPNVGNMFLSVGLKDGRVKIYNVPSFNMACELRFSELGGKDCVRLALNLSRELPTVPLRSPFRDLLLTTVWSNGRVMICQVQKQ